MCYNPNCNKYTEMEMIYFTKGRNRGTMIFDCKKAKKSVAWMLSILMLVAFMPSVAFATEEDSKENTEATQDVNKAYEEASKAEAEAKKARDDAFAAKKKEVQKAYEGAKTSYNNAKKAYDATEGVIKTKADESKKAKDAKAKLESELTKLNEQKNTAHQLEFSIPKEIEKAEKTKTDTENKWKQDKEAADKAVNDAQAACDTAGKEFINKKINEGKTEPTEATEATKASGTEETTKAGSTETTAPAAAETEKKGKDLDAMIEACKTYTGANVEPITDKDGNKYTTIAEIANSKNFETLVKRGCRYENLKKSVKYIKEANTHRNLSIHNAGELKVSYQLMGTAIISGAISVYQTGHNLLKGDKDWTFWKSGDSKTAAENLAYSPVSSEAGWDPFHGWYYDERIVDLAGTGASQATIDKVLKESETNGFPYSPYKAPWNQSKDYYRSHLDSQTGHYKTLVDSKMKATGFAYIDGEAYKVSKYPYVAVQEFNGDTTETVTIDEYEKELEEWFKPYLKPLNTAKTNRKALDKEPEALTEAKKTIKEKQEELDKAKKTVKDTTEAINKKKAEVEKATTALEQKQKALKDAQTDKANKKKAMDKAKKTMDSKASLNKKAQKLDAEKPSTYKDFGDLKKLADAYAKAKKAKEDAAAKKSEAEENKSDDGESNNNEE